MRLEYIHLTRGFAIILIVALHCQQVLRWPENDRTLEFLNVVIWDGSSVFFTIAGFLFHHLSSKFQFRQYLVGKLRNVLVPFLIVGLPGVLHTLNYWHLSEWHPELVGYKAWFHFLFLYAYPGEQYNSALWFIPVIATYFIVAPVFIWLIRHPAWIIAALAVAFAYALTNNRPSVFKYQHVGLVLYFAAPYLLGIVCSMYRERLVVWIDRHLLSLWLAWLVVVFVQFSLGHGTIHRFDYRTEGLDFNLYPASRALLFLALIGSFRLNESKPVPVVTPILSRLGELSFPIFFIHMYVMKIMFESSFGFKLDGNLVNALLVTAATLAISAAIAASIRSLMGVRSRYLLGS